MLHIIVISAWWDWPGDYSWGSRLSTDILPLLGLLAVPTTALLLESRMGMCLLLALGLVGFAVQVPCIAWEAHRWNLAQPRNYWSWANPPFFCHPSR
jgi:hypothetical protein